MKYNYDCDEWDLEKRMESDHPFIKPLREEKMIFTFPHADRSTAQSLGTLLEILEKRN